MSVVIAIAFSASGLSMPAMPALFLDLLAGAAAPTALFALGIALIGQPVRAAWGELTALTLFKLFVHPLMMALVFLSFPAIGPQPFDPLWVKIALIFQLSSHCCQCFQSGRILRCVQRPDSNINYADNLDGRCQCTCNYVFNFCVNPRLMNSSKREDEGLLHLLRLVLGRSYF